MFSEGNCGHLLNVDHVFNNIGQRSGSMVTELAAMAVVGMRHFEVVCLKGTSESIKMIISGSRLKNLAEIVTLCFVKPESNDRLCGICRSAVLDLSGNDKHLEAVKYQLADLVEVLNITDCGSLKFLEIYGLT